MTATSNRDRLAEAAERAKAAEARGDVAQANEEWRRYRLILNADRDPDDLLAEGIALSAQAIALAAAADSRHRHKDQADSAN